MSWTQGQQNRTNQSPFIDPVHEDRSHQKSAPSTGYTKPAGQRNDYNQRPQYTQRTPQTRDVAATFTQEGLQTFSLIFSSAVEAAIVKTLPELVERAVDRKMQELMTKARLEVDALVSAVAAQVAKEIGQTLESHLQNDGSSVPQIAEEISAVEPISSVTETVAPATIAPAEETHLEQAPVEQASVAKVPVEQPPVEQASVAKVPVEQPPVEQAPVAKVLMEQPPVEQAPVAPTSAADVLETQGHKRTTGRIAAELEAVTQTLKELGRPVKIDELKNALPDVHWGSNPSIKMNNLIQKSDGQIERAGRGIYQYHEA